MIPSNAVATAASTAAGDVPAGGVTLFIAAVVIGVLGALLGRLRKRGRDEAPPGARRQTARDGAGRSGRSAGRTVTVDRHDEPGESPGQFGPAATRDLGADRLQSLTPQYAPRLDAAPDPGEVVWTWVPYAEHDGRGKDRPVLLLARIDAESFAACYLSTKQHGGFVSLGTGAWDHEGRESFLAPDRVLQVFDGGMRRGGQQVSQPAFQRAVQAVSAAHRAGW